MVPWPTDALLAVGLASAGAVYAVRASRWNAMQRRVPRRWPAWQTSCFLVAMAVMFVCFSTAMDRAADSSFAMHMLQHLLLLLVWAPLLLLSRPSTLALTTAAPVWRRRWAKLLHGRPATVLSQPIVGWLAMLVVLWASHFSSLYESALDHPLVHVAEHAAYIAAALLFWFPVIGGDPSRWRMSFPLRLLYLFTFVPQAAFLGAIIEQSRRVLYPHYAATASHGSALLDQQNGGVIMWLGGAVVSLGALLLTAAAWARTERGAAEPVSS